jgi:hypothetical protein
MGDGLLDEADNVRGRAEWGKEKGRIEDMKRIICAAEQAPRKFYPRAIHYID